MEMLAFSAYLDACHLQRPLPKLATRTRQTGRPLPTRIAAIDELIEANHRRSKMAAKPSQRVRIRQRFFFSFLQKKTHLPGRLYLQGMTRTLAVPPTPGGKDFEGGNLAQI